MFGETLMYRSVPSLAPVAPWPASSGPASTFVQTASMPAVSTACSTPDFCSSATRRLPRPSV